MKRTCVTAMGLIVLGVIACAPERTKRVDRVRNDVWEGSDPPEFAAEPEHWINTGRPVTLERLRGKTAWLQFNF